MCWLTIIEQKIKIGTNQPPMNVEFYFTRDGPMGKYSAISDKDQAKYNPKHDTTIDDNDVRAKRGSSLARVMEPCSPA